MECFTQFIFSNVSESDRIAEVKVDETKDLFLFSDWVLDYLPWFVSNATFANELHHKTRAQAQDKRKQQKESVSRLETPLER